MLTRMTGCNGMYLCATGLQLGCNWAATGDPGDLGGPGCPGDLGGPYGPDGPVDPGGPGVPGGQDGQAYLILTPTAITCGGVLFFKPVYFLA